MAVRAEHDVARLDEAGLQHNVLADTVIDVKDVLDALTLGKLTNNLLVVRNLLRMGRRLEVEGVGNLARIPNLCVPAHLLFKLKHAVCAAKVPRGREIDVAPYAVADADFVAAGALHDLHDRCLAHCYSPFSLNCKRITPFGVSLSTVTLFPSSRVTCSAGNSSVNAVTSERTSMPCSPNR